MHGLDGGPHGRHKNQLTTAPPDVFEMHELIRTVTELISEHGLKILSAAAFTIAGWAVAHWRASRAWRRREFFGRINFSLNTITDGTMRIRTLNEKSCADVFLNEVAVRKMDRLMGQTTPQDPVIPIPKNDCWYYLNAVLNELSEQFAAGLLARELGHDVRSAQYLICLTNECHGEMRTRKLRAMVIRKDLLQQLPEDTPAFESPHHQVRWTTLQHLSERYAREPWRFLEVELVA